MNTLQVADHLHILEDAGSVELNLAYFFFLQLRQTVTANRSLKFAVDIENTMLNVPDNKKKKPETIAHGSLHFFSRILEGQYDILKTRKIRSLEAL